MSSPVARGGRAERWRRYRRPLAIAGGVLAVLAAVLLTVLADEPGADPVMQAVVGPLVVVLVALSAIVVLTGVWWALGGRSPTPGVLVAIGGLSVLPTTLGAMTLGTGSGEALGLLPAAAWVTAGIAAGAVPTSSGVRPVATPAWLDRRPWWLLVRLLSVVALAGLLVLVGSWAAEAFSLFPGKEREEGLERIRRAAAWQWRTMLLGALPIVLLWWLMLRRRAAASVLAVAAVIGSAWSIVGFAASLPVFITAVVLLFLPARPVLTADPPQVSTGTAGSIGSNGSTGSIGPSSG
jgi:hypothetical protein